MIVHVARRAIESGSGRVVVATDSDEIAAAVDKSGFEAVTTRPDHQSGSDRIFEALQTVDPKEEFDTIVNVQGDLPTIEPETIRASLNPLTDPQVDIATLGVEIIDETEKTNPTSSEASIMRMLMHYHITRFYGSPKAIDISRLSSGKPGKNILIIL